MSDTSDVVRILLIEDDPADAELIQRLITRAGIVAEFHRVDQEPDLLEALDYPWTAILCDFTLPGWNGLQALQHVRHRAADLPFIFVSGSIGEDVAVRAMRAGADDYLLKGNLRRLAPALTREIQAHRNREDARAAEHARVMAEQQYGRVVESAADAIITIGPDQLIRTFNRGAERTFGRSAVDMIGRPLDVLVPDRMREMHRRMVQQFLDGTLGDITDPDHADVVAMRADGSEFPAQTTLSRAGNGPDLVATAILRDVTAVRESEERIRFLAHFDSLTQLPNRVLFRERLDMATLEARRKGRQVGVVVLDLDRFKSVNDSRGHTAGDALLRAVAGRLSGVVRADDTVARLGGDEFGVVLADLASESDAGRLVGQLIESLRFPLTAGGARHLSTASAGITLFPTDGGDPERLLSNADMAMYRAKRRGGDRFEFYRPEMTVREQRRAETERDLGEALHRSRLTVQFQPQIRLSDSQVIGCEALARWAHPVRGLIPPTEFIRIAEDAGLIGAVGKDVMRIAMTTAAGWLATHPRVRLGLNTSVRELTQPDYVDQVLDALSDSGLDPQLLELELTEGDLQEEHRPAIDAMRRFAAAGVGFAIDDFGTGYSNLSRLRQLPFRTLKIDRSLIADIPGDREDLAIVAAVVTMAGHLGLQTLAEGAERPEQVEALAELGCEVIQGFALARPMWADDLRTYLADHSVRGAGLP